MEVSIELHLLEPATQRYQRSSQDWWGKRPWELGEGEGDCHREKGSNYSSNISTWTVCAVKCQGVASEIDRWQPKCQVGHLLAQWSGASYLTSPVCNFLICIMEIRVTILWGVMRLKCKNTPKQLAQCLAHNGSHGYYYYMSYWYFYLISDNTQ